MKRIAALFCLLVFPSLTCAQPPVGEPKAVKAPFELLKTQHMVVNVKINGEGPFRLIFDTGAPVTLLNNKVARAAGLVDKKLKQPVFPLFPGMGQFKVKTLQIGELTADSVPVIVMDHPTVTAISKVLGPIEGIVGFSLFARYKMTIDYQAKEMTFVPVKFEPADMMSRMMALLSGPAKEPKVIAPAGQWGFRVKKSADDLEPGVVVQEVLPGSPAAQSGLKAGDRLLTLDSRWTDTVADCYVAASHVPPGATARMQIKRDGKEVELTIKVKAGL
jgi:hypothetical protein